MAKISNQEDLIPYFSCICNNILFSTKERFIIEYGSNKAKHALFSVPLSKAQALDGIFWKDFKRKYVHYDYRVLEEYEQLQTRAIYEFKTYIYMTLAFIIQLQKKS